jgi:tetratricopeptide (TPR) repeat protein
MKPISQPCIMRTFTLLFVGTSLVTQLAWGQSKPAQAAYKKAIGYLNKGKTEKGFALLDKALQADSTYREAWYAKGYYAFAGNNYPTALAAFNKLIRMHPADTTFYRYRALTHMYLEDYESSEKTCKKPCLLIPPMRIRTTTWGTCITSGANRGRPDPV